MSAIRSLTTTSPDDKAVIEVTGIDLVELTLFNPTKDTPGDIVMVVGNTTMLLNKFSARENYDRKTNSYPASIGYLYFNVVYPILLIFGLYKIVCIKSGNIVEEALLLNRSDKDDQGFFTSFDIHEYEEFFIVRYESGLARFSYDGHCDWHTFLKCDDFLVRAESERLVFENEHIENGKEWFIQLSDGRSSIELN